MIADTPRVEIDGRAAVEDCLKAHGKDLARFNVQSLELFGSALRGATTDQSDIDLLVTFEGPIDLLSFIELEELLGEILGHRVDLVPRESLKPLLAEAILSDAVRVY